MGSRCIHIYLYIHLYFGWLKLGSRFWLEAQVFSTPVILAPRDLELNIPEPEEGGLCGSSWIGPQDLPHGEGLINAAKGLPALTGFGKTKFVRDMSVDNVAWPGHALLKDTAIILPPEDHLPDLKEGLLLARSQ